MNILSIIRFNRIPPLFEGDLDIHGIVFGMSIAVYACVTLVLLAENMR